MRNTAQRTARRSSPQLFELRRNLARPPPTHAQQPLCSSRSCCSRPSRLITNSCFPFRYSAGGASTLLCSPAAACTAAAMYANGSRAQPFLVIKGYHMGSAWFEEAFNKLSGVSFFFEYEHCLRDLAPAGSQLASPMLTFRHLQQSCGSCADQQRTTRCRACGVVPPPDGSRLHVLWRALH